VLEFQLDPALQRIDELSLADMVMPSGRLGHAGDCQRYLRPHPAVGGLGDAEVAVLEELAPSLHEFRRLRAGHGELHRRLRLGWPILQCGLLYRHTDLLQSGFPSIEGLELAAKLGEIRLVVT